MPWKQHHQRFSAAQGLLGESREYWGNVTKCCMCFNVGIYEKDKGYDRGEHIMMGTCVFLLGEFENGVGM